MEAAWGNLTDRVWNALIIPFSHFPFSRETGGMTTLYYLLATYTRICVPRRWTLTCHKGEERPCYKSLCSEIKLLASDSSIKHRENALPRAPGSKKENHGQESVWAPEIPPRHPGKAAWQAHRGKMRGGTIASALVTGDKMPALKPRAIYTQKDGLLFTRAGQSRSIWVLPSAAFV